MKRYALTLELRRDAALIEEYEVYHQNVWPEVQQSIHAAGVLDMQIYRLHEKLFMVMETEDDFLFERKAAMDAANPVVQRWESLMAKFQDVDEGQDASRKWQLMEKIFQLDPSGAADA